MKRADLPFGFVVQEALRAYLAMLGAAAKMPLAAEKALERVLSCRTTELGARVLRCLIGCTQIVVANQCRGRACPICGPARVVKWVQKQLAFMLACDHVHVIFTLPAQLRPLFRANRAVMTRLMFQAAKSTLLSLLADPDYLGARPGILAVFQSWGFGLTLHPHLHVVVTYGGLDKSGIWRTPRHPILLPYGVVSAKFRGKLLSLIRRRFKRRQLCLPPGITVEKFFATIEILYERKFNVHLKSARNYLPILIHYLGEGLRIGPITHREKFEYDPATKMVQFWWKDYFATPPGAAQPVRQLVRQRLQVFGPLWAEHSIVARGLKLSRGYGLYANAKAARRALAIARAALGQPPLAPPTPKDPPADFADAPDRARSWDKADLDAHGQWRCRICGTPLIEINPEHRHARRRHDPAYFARGPPPPTSVATRLQHLLAAEPIP